MKILMGRWLNGPGAERQAWTARRTMRRRRPIIYALWKWIAFTRRGKRRLLYGGRSQQELPNRFPHQPLFAVAANEDYILEILIENGLVTKSQLDEARAR